MDQISHKEHSLKKNKPEGTLFKKKFFFCSTLHFSWKTEKLWKNQSWWNLDEGKGIFLWIWMSSKTSWWVTWKFPLLIQQLCLKPLCVRQVLLNPGHPAVSKTLTPSWAYNLERLKDKENMTICDMGCDVLDIQHPRRP